MAPENQGKSAQAFTNFDIIGDFLDAAVDSVAAVFLLCAVVFFWSSGGLGLSGGVFGVL